MKSAKEPPRADRSALPRKIACGDICGDPGVALYQMLCVFKAALTKLFAKWRESNSPLLIRNE